MKDRRIDIVLYQDSGMTRDTAYKYMLSGYKMTHKSFTDNEYIHIKNGRMITEDGYPFKTEFFNPNNKRFLSGWRQFKEPSK